MNARKLYMDYNASAPLHPAVRALLADMLGQTGNASSVHGYGRAARTRIETAREQVAALAGIHANQVVFTSGATEANNAVLQTFRGQHILVSAIEHPSVLEAAPDATLIPVTADGVIDEAAFAALLDQGPPPALISLMAANNETGAIQPVGRLAKIARKKYPQVHIHCDAVQAAGRIPLAFAAWHCDYMTLSAHKMGGPQGAGALIIAPGAPPARLLQGGGQEKRQRAGTENVLAIAGFGLAAALAEEAIDDFAGLAVLRDQLENILLARFPGLVIHAKAAPRVANTSLFSLPGAAAPTQIMALDLAGIAVSSGSACSSGTVKPSHVLAAMSVPVLLSECALRVSFGSDTTAADIETFTNAWTIMAQRVAGTK